jgi:MFS transporter, SP family, solute carrier family 2 (myo-inositol transporter), member 13
MARLDTNDLTAVGAPLLALDENRIDRVDDDHDSRLFSDPGLKGTGTGFVWALTSSAGISGLLFGYEYERGSNFQTLSANISPFPLSSQR